MASSSPFRSPLSGGNRFVKLGDLVNRGGTAERPELHNSAKQERPSSRVGVEYSRNPIPSSDLFDITFLISRSPARSNPAFHPPDWMATFSTCRPQVPIARYYYHRCNKARLGPVRPNQNTHSLPTTWLNHHPGREGNHLLILSSPSTPWSCSGTFEVQTEHIARMATIDSALG